MVEGTKYLHTVYRLQQCLASSELLTPLHRAICVLPPHQRRGGGGQYFGRLQTLDWPLTV
jgi:hypothetical protein